MTTKQYVNLSVEAGYSDVFGNENLRSCYTRLRQNCDQRATPMRLPCNTRATFMQLPCDTDARRSNRSCVVVESQRLTTALGTATGAAMEIFDWRVQGQGIWGDGSPLVGSRGKASRLGGQSPPESEALLKSRY